MATARSSWIIAAPLLVVAGLILLWSGYWYTTLTQAKAGLSGFERDLTARGGAFSCGEEAWGGYPFRVSLACQRLAIRLSPRGATFETSNVGAVAQAYALGHVIAVAEGPSRLSLEDGAAWEVEHAPMTSAFRIDARGEAAADLVVADTKLKAGGRFVAKSDRLRLHARNLGPREVEFAIIGEGATAGFAAGAKFDISRLDLRGTIDNLPPGFATYPSDLLTAAATSGARLSLTSLDAVVDGFSLKGSGAVTLGADGFPEGKISLRLSDLDRLMAALEAKGLIDRNAAAASALLLGLLLGKQRETPIDLTFRAGRIRLGPFVLIEHGPIR